MRRSTRLAARGRARVPGQSRPTLTSPSSTLTSKVCGLDREVEVVLARLRVVFPAVPRAREVVVRVEHALSERPFQVQTVPLERVELAVEVDERDLDLAGLHRGNGSGRDVGDLGDRHEIHAGSDGNRVLPSGRRGDDPAGRGGSLHPGQARGLAPDHHLVTTDSADPPDLVIADVARLDPYDVADEYPDVPLLGFTNHKDTAGLRRANEAGFDQVVAKSALDDAGSRTDRPTTRLGRLTRPDDLHHRRALHRHQRPVLRGRLPGRLHPRVRADPDHRPGGVHRLLRARRAAADDVRACGRSRSSRTSRAAC